MKKSAKSIKTEIDGLTYKLKNNEISVEEAFIIFERIISDLTAIYGTKNSIVNHLKNDFIKTTFRLQGIQELKKDLLSLKEEENILVKKYSLSL